MLLPDALFGEAGAVTQQLRVQHLPDPKNAEQGQLIDTEQEQRQQNPALQPDALFITRRRNTLVQHQRLQCIRAAIYMNVHQRKQQYITHVQAIPVHTIERQIIHPGVPGLTGAQHHALRAIWWIVIPKQQTIREPVTGAVGQIISTQQLQQVQRQTTSLTLNIDIKQEH